ncbi:hypothetical protein [Natrinema soli]|uniref:hypothetical protein n=1 Tax=Natrinema soli TaxID=1930624 RepID=UPI00235DE778|nr:hypothetical protein [Natrinema soli]
MSGLDAGEAYWILCDAQGREYVRGRAAVNYPRESGAITATHGIYTEGGSRSQNYRYCIDRIRTGPTASEIGGVLDLERDDEAQSWSDLSKRSGVRLRATAAVSGLECRISTETEGLTTAYVTTDSGSVLAQQPIGDLEAGDAFVLDVDLSAGETYWVVCDADGQSFVRGRAAVDYPLESDVLEATHGIYAGDGAQSDQYRYCLDRIQPTAASSQIGATLTLGSDEIGQSWSGLTQPSGVRIETTEEIGGIECRLSAATQGITTAYLTSDTGEIIERQTLVMHEAGDTFTFDTRLEADTAYRLLCGARGQEYVRGRTEVDYPRRSDSIVATNGIYSGRSFSSNYRYCLDRVRPATDGQSASESIGESGTPLDLQTDETAQSWRSLTEPAGVRLQATEQIAGLECRLSTLTDEVTTAYLTDDSGTVLAQQSLTDSEAGDIITFDVELAADAYYRILCDADGQRYVRGRAAIEYPLEGDSLRVTDGVYSGDALSSSYRYCIDQITPVVADRELTEGLGTRPTDVTVVNVLEHPAIDASGDLSAEILSYLEAQNEINHAFVLPMGTYTWNTGFYLGGSLEYLEISGDPRATLQVRDPAVDVAFEFGRWGNTNPPQRVVLRNLDVDIDDQPDRDAGLLIAHVNSCLVDNIELIGQRWRHGPEGGDRYTCLVNTRDTEGLSVIRNLSLPDGDREDPAFSSVGHSIGISADPPHNGVNVWTQCYVEEFVDNGFYVRNSPGYNIVDHSLAVNCGNGSVRLGEADEARDCKIRLDRGSEQTYPGTGLWLNGDQPTAERITIDGSDAHNDLLRVNSGADGGHVRDLSLRCGSSATAPTVRCSSTSETDLQGVLIEDFAITDVSTANNNPSVNIRRSDVTFRSGVIDVANRPALGGTEMPTLEDIEIR